MILDHVQAAIGEHHARVDVWMLLEEIRDDGKQIKPSERDRRGQNQFAFQRLGFARCIALGVVEIGQNAAGGRHETTRPASVSSTLRVDRISSRAFKCFSSSAILRLTVASGDRSFRDAAEILPASATATNKVIASSRSIGRFPDFGRDLLSLTL